MTDGPKRIVVVHGAHTREYWADDWDVQLQDDGRTMKLFASGGGTTARTIRDKALGKDLAAGVKFIKENDL